MAKNLRSKIPASDTMYVHDVNETAKEKFASEFKGVKAAKDVREVAENSVCKHLHPPLPQLYMMNVIFSFTLMI